MFFALPFAFAGGCLPLIKLPPMNLGRIVRSSLVYLKETSAKIRKMSVPQSVLQKNQLVRDELRKVREEVSFYSFWCFENKFP